jgi:hypothetical protein
MQVSSQPPDHDPPDRWTLERLMPELVRRVLETGTKNLTPESVRSMLGDLRPSRETLNSAFSQLDETKNVVTRAFSREIRELLDRTSLGEELAKALSLLTLEVKMEVRFKPSTISAPSNTSPFGAKVRVRRSDSPQQGPSEDHESGNAPASRPETEPQENK